MTDAEIHFTLDELSWARRGVAAPRRLTEELDTIEAAALGLAMNHILQQLGPNVTETRFGKALGGGLFEFRLDDTVDELLRRFKLRKKAKLGRASSDRMLLRVFFHVYGEKVVLLLGGYDKGKADSKRQQQAEIALARARLRDWLSRGPAKTRRAGKRSR